MLINWRCGTGTEEDSDLFCHLAVSSVVQKRSARKLPAPPQNARKWKQGAKTGEIITVMIHHGASADYERWFGSSLIEIEFITKLPHAKENSLMLVACSQDGFWFEEPDSYIRLITNQWLVTISNRILFANKFHHLTLVLNEQNYLLDALFLGLLLRVLNSFLIMLNVMASTAWDKNHEKVLFQ